MAQLPRHVLRRLPSLICPLVRCPMRESTSKHWDIKWRELRKKKVFKPTLFDFDDIRKDESMTLEERRSKMKKDGRLPPRSFQELPINISSTSMVFEPYVPPEGDGKVSFITPQGAKQRLDFLSKKGKSYNQLRKIRQFEELDTAVFADEAKEVYMKAHEALAEKDKDALHELVTEKAYPEMMQGMKNVTVKWRYLESIEPPRVVHVRTNEMLNKENLYGQVTVRLHSRQTLAVYDRFGRLMYGDPDEPRDVLEYVVLEKHLSNVYGNWRVHGKISPPWATPTATIRRTYREQRSEVAEKEEEEGKEGEKEVATV